MAASAPASAHNSTPHSKHISSMKNVEGVTYTATLDGNKPFLRFDLQSTREVELDHFLAAFSRMDMESLRDANQKVDPITLKGEFKKIEKDLESITTNKEVSELRDAYCTSAKGLHGNKEKARYGPFVSLANKILELLCRTEDIPKTEGSPQTEDIPQPEGSPKAEEILQTEGSPQAEEILQTEGGPKTGNIPQTEGSPQNIPITFCRNDPHQLGGVLKNVRVPDVVVIDGSHKSVKDGKWDHYSNFPTGTPRDTRYTWADVLFTVEFKLRDNLIPVPGQSADARPRFVPRTNRGSTPMGDEIVLGPGASYTPQFHSLPNEFSAASYGRPSSSAFRPVSLAGSLKEAGPPNLGGKSSKKMSEVQRSDVMSESGGRGRSNRVRQGIASDSAHKASYRPSGSSMGSKRSLSMDSESETEGSCSKRPRNSGYLNKAPVELCEQGLCYAIEQFSYMHSLRHVYNAIVIDGKMWICYYDHAGVIRTSQPLDFVNDLFRFVFLLKCMMDMDRVERGVSEHLVKFEDKDPPSSSISNDIDKVIKADAPGPIVKTGADLNATQKDAISGGFDFIAQFGLSIKGQVFRFIRRLANMRFYGLLGRATEVVEAKLLKLEGNVVTCKIEVGKVVAVKMSWPPKSRVSEVVIIGRAREVLQKLDKNYDYRKKNGIKGKLEDCLPVVYESEDRDDLVETKGCFRQRLNMLEFVDGVENRVWRTIVFEVLVPIHMLDNLGKFKKCFRGIFQGHHFLWIHGIMHRDISIGNLMCRIGEDGRVCGVLNDWDLAKLKDSKEPTSNSRTGTRPFMARDLLTDEPQEHLERFDWESMLYVLIWIACHYGSGGVLEKPNALPVWIEHDLGRLRDNKSSVCGGEFPPFTEHYGGLRIKWILPMLRLFRSGYDWKYMGQPPDETEVEESTDETDVGEFSDGADVEELIVEINVEGRTEDIHELSTLGGHVTYKKLRRIYMR